MFEVFCCQSTGTQILDFREHIISNSRIHAQIRVGHEFGKKEICILKSVLTQSSDKHCYMICVAARRKTWPERGSDQGIAVVLQCHTFILKNASQMLKPKEVRCYSRARHTKHTKVKT